VLPGDLSSFFFRGKNRIGCIPYRGSSPSSEGVLPLVKGPGLEAPEKFRALKFILPFALF
jgi:hypothetical protein